MRKRACPDPAEHTRCPEGYMAWHSWAERMSKTHRQFRCPHCGLFEVWKPKSAGLSPCALCQAATVGELCARCEASVEVVGGLG